MSPPAVARRPETATPPAPSADPGHEAGWRGVAAYCRHPPHLRRTLLIALVVGIVLTAINQGDVLLGGSATTLTFVKCALNFVVPFVVSNLGLLGGRPRPGG